jgi:hypothetical protein
VVVLETKSRVTFWITVALLVSGRRLDGADGQL